MDFLKVVGATLGALVLTGCQLGYYMHSAYYQTKLIRARQPVERALRGDALNDEQKRKLRLTQDAKAFAESTLGLKSSSNYTSFVKLDEPYVTYIVQAAYPFELKAYHWHFPFVGAVPYKGYFRRALAEDEAKQMAARDFDTYVRGVTAYSTLGWFEDSVLSSMLGYADVDLVETIIHETVHTTLFVKGGTEFNERLATFMGHAGMLMFYRAREGESSVHVREAGHETEDQRLFSSFITRETESLKAWYAANGAARDRAARAARLGEIKTRYLADIKPRLKARGYAEFEKRELNNALLLAYGTYEYGLEDFEKLYAHFDFDYRRTLEWLMTLKNEPKPEVALKAFVAAGGQRQ